jgi:hypothetical protein
MNVCIMPRPRGVIYNNNNSNDQYFLSTSMTNAVNEMKSKIDITNPELLEICKIINPHEYVFSSVSENGCPPLSVSKINPPSNFYYELREIINSFGLLRMVYSSVLYISEHIDNTMQLLFTSATTHVIHTAQHLDQPHELVDIIIINATTNSIPYIKHVLCSLHIDSPLIIKISNITNKDSIHMLYLLSSTFEKVYMVKPSVVNIMSDDIFIVCVSFCANYLDVNLDAIEIPAIFLSKIEEFNSINGHIQLDAYEQVFNIMYNRNKWSKLDLLKKSNIQKSQVWCDKNNIPYNKMGDKVNIFLHT